jgi:hypothetical protein
VREFLLSVELPGGGSIFQEVRIKWPTIHKMATSLLCHQGGLQKQGGLCLTLGYRVCDVVIKKNVRTY